MFGLMIIYGFSCVTGRLSAYCPVTKGSTMIFSINVLF